jgi:hypothetical protein
MSITLNKAKLTEVRNLLKPETGKPITKKLACEMLGIAYNTARLDKMITEHEEEVLRQKKKKDANRGKPATDYEISCCIESYLDKEPMSLLVERLGRSRLFVQRILDVVGLPERSTDNDYFNPVLLDEGFSQEYLEEGALVYSARHQEVGEVKGNAPCPIEGAYWVRLATEEYIAIMYYDLLPLDEMVKKYNLKLNLSCGIDTKAALNQTLSKALKYDN